MRAGPGDPDAWRSVPVLPCRWGEVPGRLGDERVTDLCPHHQRLYDGWQSPTPQAWYSIGGPNIVVVMTNRGGQSVETAMVGYRADYDRAAARLREILAGIVEDCRAARSCALFAVQYPERPWPPAPGVLAFLARTLEIVLEADGWSSDARF